jgi:hypothetical protein
MVKLDDYWPLSPLILPMLDELAKGLHLDVVHLRYFFTAFICLLALWPLEEGQVHAGWARPTSRCIG